MAKKVVHPVEKGLKSDLSKKVYRWHFNTFVKWLEYKYSTIIVDERLVQLGGQQLQLLLIEYIEHMDKDKHLKYATINAAMFAVVHFCDMNDIDLNRRKISRFLPADENHEEDRTYTRKEIELLLSHCDARFKAVILLMVNGLRIGAIPDLRIGDLTQTNQPKIYKLWVYHRSKNSKYYTFLTPECSKTIDDYLEFRKNQGERDVSIHPENQSPLIREQFKLDDKIQARNPRFVSHSTIEKTMERVVKKAGTNTVRKVMMTHGFRKFAITQMAKAKVDFSDREYLVGHKHTRGLDVNYHRTTEDEKLVEWSKAINNLTIDPAYQLQKELEVYKGEYAQKVAQLEARDKEKDERMKMLEGRLRELGFWDSCDNT